MSEKTPILEYWSWDGECMNGVIYNHPNPRFHDGKRISTSTVVNVYHQDDQLFAECKSRTYLLNVIDPEFERQYPNAEERLVKTWAERNN